MDNKKKLTIILAVLALVCVFSVLVFSGVIGDGIKIGEEPTTEADLLTFAGIDEVAKTKGSSESPYLQTEIKDIYYTMEKTTGEVKFYKLESKTFIPVEATGKYDVSVELSEQKISATVTYYKQDSAITGYGLYIGAKDEFDLYPYAFFSLVNYGENYKYAKDSGCILLVDTSADDFYSNTKIYEEPFAFTYSDSSCSRILSEANRTVGLSGAKRSDYTLINTATVNGSTEHFLFFSGRYYGEEDPMVDLMRSGGSGNNTDNIRIAKDVLGFWATYTDDGVMYITTNANGDVVVQEYNTDSEKTEDVKTFTGIKRDGIIVNGGYIYIVSTNTVYDIMADKETQLKFEKSDMFTADMFCQENGKTVVRGYIDKRYPTFIVTSGETSAVYNNDIFRFIVNPIVAIDGVIVTIEANNNFSYYIF